MLALYSKLNSWSSKINDELAFAECLLELQDYFCLPAFRQAELICYLTQKFNNLNHIYELLETKFIRKHFQWPEVHCESIKQHLKSLLTYVFDALEDKDHPIAAKFGLPSTTTQEGKLLAARTAKLITWILGEDSLEAVKLESLFEGLKEQDACLEVVTQLVQVQGIKAQQLANTIRGAKVDPATLKLVLPTKSLSYVAKWIKTPLLATIFKAKANVPLLFEQHLDPEHNTLTL